MLLLKWNSSAMTPHTIYRRFVEFDERAAGIYLRIASLFSEHTELSQSWLDMAIEQKTQADFLRFCLLEGLFTTDLPDYQQIRRLNRMFEMLENEVELPVLTLEKALALSAKIETSPLNSLSNQLTLPAHRSPYLLRRKIQILNLRRLPREQRHRRVS